MYSCAHLPNKVRGSCSDGFSDESDLVQIEGSLNFGSEQLKNMESIPKHIYEKYLANFFYLSANRLPGWFIAEI